MNTFELTLDLDKSVGVKQWITLRQGDKRGTTLRATLYDHGVLVSGSYTCRVSIRHPNRNTYYRETATYNNGVATVTIDETSAASVVGVTEGYFELLQGSTLIASTESFGVRVLQSATDGATVGPPYDSAIEDALAELDAATGRISQMVVDATAEYLAAHPEITTTVQDNSVTDAKLIQSGGVLDRVGRLWWRLENLLTNTPAESESVTVSDAAKTPVAGLTVFGKSTQDGTPTPDAPVAIQSVTPNLYRQTQYEAGFTRTSGGLTITYNSDGTCTCTGTSSYATLWGGGNATDDRLFVTLPAGTYCVCGSHYVAVQKKVGETVTNVVSTISNFATFTLTEDTLIKAMPIVPAGVTLSNDAVWVAVYEGDTWQPYVPYANVGLRASRRNMCETSAKVLRIANTSGSWSDNAWTLNGVTFTVNPFGSITANGTASGLTNMLLMRRGFALPAGTYHLSGCPSGGSDNTYRIDVYAIGSTVALAVDYGSGAQFTLTERTTIDYMRIRVPSGASLSNKTFYPMIRPASLSPEWVPYADSVTALPTDGHTLRSLPDGTRDEVTVDQYGHVTLVQRTGSVSADTLASASKTIVELADVVRISYGNVLNGKPSRGYQGNPAGSGWCNVAPYVNNYTQNAVHAYAHNAYVYVFAPKADKSTWDATTATEWTSEHATELVYALATPVTHDLGTIEPTALVGPDMTAQTVPTAPFALTYERDLNATLARLEAALATLA